jgi:F0F1-type ATP synthase membrane subunit b/b'
MIFNFLLLVLIVVALGFGIQFILIKTGKLQDKDGDNIADELEDKYADIKEDVYEKFEDVKGKVKDVVEDVKETVKEVKAEAADIISAVQGKPTKAKLNALTKQELVDIAKNEFDVELDMSATKSNLVNKVYALYKK